MIFIVKVIDGVKKIIPVTADVGAGNPVGTIIVVCSNQIPSNYLPLGTQFDTTLYPVLYALLGTDTTPTASALGLPTLTSGQYAIKATSGLSENAQDNVINTLNEQRSYSTEEHLTGRKWIDGKPTYEIVLTCTTTGTLTPLTWNDMQTIFNGVAQLSIDSLVKVNVHITKGYTSKDIDRFIINEPTIQQGHLSALINKSINSPLILTQNESLLTLEYTKTTD